MAQKASKEKEVFLCIMMSEAAPMFRFMTDAKLLDTIRNGQSPDRASLSLNSDCVVLKPLCDFTFSQIRLPERKITVLYDALYDSSQWSDCQGVEAIRVAESCEIAL